jgi:acyl-CoA reductase-like NAD-dependent aldehyde dehydrogenase
VLDSFIDYQELAVNTTPLLFLLSPTPIIGILAQMPTVLPKDTDGRPFVACIIDGQPLARSHQPYIPILSSQKQETVHFSQSVDASTAVLAVKSSWKAFQAYRKTPTDERRRLLTKAAELFDNGISDAMHRQMTETSCNEDWAKMNAGSMSVICQELAAALEDLSDPAHDERSIVVREPIGPVLSIIPCVNSKAALLPYTC